MSKDSFKSWRQQEKEKAGKYFGFDISPSVVMSDKTKIKCEISGCEEYSTHICFHKDAGMGIYCCKTHTAIIMLYSDPLATINEIYV